MYAIYADKKLIYDGRLDDNTIGKGSVSLEVNKSGSCTFSLYPDHDYYDRLKDRATYITVERDDRLIYRGRVLKHSDSFYRERTFTCEGELSFLLDSIIRPYNFTGTPAALFRQIITTHNSQVEEAKRFTIGTITVTDPNNYINRKNSAYESSLENIKTRLLETHGGYIIFTEGPNNTRVINWLSELTYLNGQTIEFGENLLDFVKEVNTEDIVTALIPLGARLDTTDGDELERHLTIESVTSGHVDYVYDQTAVNKYGWVFASETWDDVTVASNLLTKGRARLNELVNPYTTIELSAADLSAMDEDIEAFNYGDYVRVISAPHNLDAVYLLSKQTIDLLHGENNKITLGYTYQTLTDKTITGSAFNKLLNAQISDLSAISNNINAQISDLSAISNIINGSGGWINLTVDPAFTTVQAVQYRETNNQVYVRGAASAVTAFTSSETLVTIASGIPAAYRPSYNIEFIISAGGLTTWICTITTDGLVTISRYTEGGAYGEIDPSLVLNFSISYSI